jgi:hypothetical protein
MGTALLYIDPGLWCMPYIIVSRSFHRRD